MKITLRQLQIFVAVARTSSTAEAGRSLPLSQSATSAAINDIENLLGTLLFDRVGKRLVLNDNGRLPFRAQSACWKGPWTSNSSSSMPRTVSLRN